MALPPTDPPPSHGWTGLWPPPDPEQGRWEPPPAPRNTRWPPPHIRHEDRPRPEPSVRKDGELSTPSGGRPRRSRRAAVSVAFFAVMFIGSRIVHLLVSPDDAGADQQHALTTKIATVTSDFGAVCMRGSISNAAAYAKPYTIIAFHQARGTVRWTETTLDSRASYAADPGALSSINVVACLPRTPGTEVASGRCYVDSGGRRMYVDRYTVDYTIDLREARTGKFIESLGTVNGATPDCAEIATSDVGSRKLYGKPDIAAVQDKLATFVVE